MTVRFKHIALYVSDLRAAEAYYAALFALTPIVREARGRESENDWATLPSDRDWADAEAAGVTIGMVGLRRDDMILALFPGTSSRDQIHAVGIVMDEEAIEEIVGRLPRDAAVATHRRGYLEFVDRYGVRWQVSTSPAFRSYGDRLGRWLDLGATRGSRQP